MINLIIQWNPGPMRSNQLWKSVGLNHWFCLFLKINKNCADHCRTEKLIFWQPRISLSALPLLCNLHYLTKKMYAWTDREELYSVLSYFETYMKSSFFPLFFNNIFFFVSLVVENLRWFIHDRSVGPEIDMSLECVAKAILA